MIKFSLSGSRVTNSYYGSVDKLSADNIGQSFCPRFSNVDAVDFDTVATDFSGWTGSVVSTVDAVLDQRENCNVAENKRRVYFVEFKNRKLEDLNLQGTPGAATDELRNDETIEVELRKKGLGSLLLSAATLFKSECLDDISFLSEFFVVYNDRRYESSAAGNVRIFDEDIRHLAGETKDAYGIPILWELNKFKGKGLYRHVHTWSIDDFNKYAPDFIK